MLFKVKYFAATILSFFKLLKGVEERNGVRVLMYHSIDFSEAPIKDLYSLKWGVFENHLRLIEAKQFEFKKISDEWAVGKKNIVLTFDDGFEDNFEVALRLSKKKIPMTIFVVSNFIDQTNYLTSEQLIELNSMPNVEIGCHGKSHRPLTTLSEMEWKEELQTSKKTLESLLNISITSMSFPHGKYLDVMVSYAYEIGFIRVATSDSGLNLQNETKIKRTTVFKYDYNWIMIQKLLGLWDNLTARTTAKELR